MTTNYNSENPIYSKFIPISEFEEMKEKMKLLEERIKNIPDNPQPTYETEDELNIDDVNSLKKLLKTENFNINMPINRAVPVYS